MLFCPRPAHRDPGGPGGNSPLDWNDAIYRPHRRHFIIQRTLTPWMSNTEHAGTELESLASPSQPEPDDERPPELKGEHHHQIITPRQAGLKRSPIRENWAQVPSEMCCWLKKVTANTEADGMVVRIHETDSLKYTAAIHLQ